MRVQGAMAALAALVEELWDWAAPAGNDVARSVLFAAGSESPEMMEGVVTPGAGAGAGAGGRPRAQVVGRPVMPLEEVLRFVSLGVQGQGGR